MNTETKNKTTGYTIATYLNTGDVQITCTYKNYIYIHNKDINNFIEIFLESLDSDQLNELKDRINSQLDI